MTSILTTLDGSPESQAVLPVLEKLASDLKARIELLTVVARQAGTARAFSGSHLKLRSPYAIPGTTTTAFIEQGNDLSWAENDDQALQRVVAEGRDYLAHIAKSLQEHGLEVHVEATVGQDIATAIVDYARQKNVDMIAMSTHGRSGLSEIVQGSVSSAVVRSGVAPVLLVRPMKE